MAIPLTLRVFRDTQLVATREFHRDIIKIGRLSSAHLCIEDDRMSRIHAVIEVGGDGAVSIIDMGSVEGTFINGKRVSKASLSSGDSVSMGNTRLEILIGAEAAAAAGEVAGGVAGADVAGAGVAGAGATGADVAATGAAAPAGEVAAGVAAAPEGVASAPPAHVSEAAAAMAASAAPGPVAGAVLPASSGMPASDAGPDAPTSEWASAPASTPAGMAATPTSGPMQAGMEAGGVSAAVPTPSITASGSVSQPSAAAELPGGYAQQAPAQQAPAGATATGPQSPVAKPGSVAAAWQHPDVQKGRISLVRERYEAEVRGRTGPLPRPIPLPTALIDRALQLDIRFFWGDQQLAVGTFDHQQQQVTIGAAAEADIKLEAGGLPADPFPMVRQMDGTWYLCFSDKMSGELIQHGEVHTFAELMQRGRARPGDEPGTHLLALPHDAAAWVDLGHIRADLCFRPTPRLLVAPWTQRLDYQFLNLFVVAFFLVAAAIVGFHNAAYDADVVQDDLYSNNARWAKTLFEAPKPRTNPMMERLALKAPKDPGSAAPKAAGVEGQAGKKEAPVRNTRSAPRAIDPNDKEVIKNQGILAMLGKGQNSGLSTIFGKGGLGGDLQGAIGGITGSTVGDAHGFGGLGLKGTGTGGGGFGNTIGVGDVGTKGRGGGQGSFGSGVGGLGKKGSSDVHISSSEAVIVGYDRELVRRVVHSHHAQLRYCYESELVRSPNMTGKVTVKWVIGGNGSVSQVSTASTTLGNKTVENCINARVRSWNFPPPKAGGIAVITYPFVFKPSGG